MFDYRWLSLVVLFIFAFLGAANSLVILFLSGYAAFVLFRAFVVNPGKAIARKHGIDIE